MKISIMILDELYRRFWNSIQQRRKQQLFLLFVLIIFTSFAEIFSIGAVFPFLAALTNPSQIFNLEELQFLWKVLEVNEPSSVLLYVTSGFILASLVSGAMRLLLIYATTRLSFGIGADISYEIYKRTLFQPYYVHINRNSAEVITGITSKASSVVTQIITPILTLLSSTVILLFIIGGLLLIDPKTTLISFSFFIMLYIFVALYSKTKLKKNGEILTNNLTTVQKSLQEGMGGIRDILLDGTQSYFLNTYRVSDSLYRKASAENYYYSASPRYVVESLGMALIGIFAYHFGRSNDSLMAALPILGSLAIAAQRVLPILQQSYYSWSNLRAGRENLSNVVELLNQSIKTANSNRSLGKLTFNHDIKIDNLSFIYEESKKEVISNVSLTIPKGNRVGIVGQTGSGKSTLMDLLMGLLVPTKGNIRVDGIELNDENIRLWQNNLAHVPQNIFLSDSSIAENIAFGYRKEEIDFQKLKIAAKKAQISEHIEQLPDGYDTFVGERGVKLSGGQRQRIGIARALYKDAEVIFLDEATSALDNDTEKAVMESIDSLDKSITIFIIAHRLSTIDGCDQKIELSEGKVIQQT
ncbi:ABC transporter ATP-binding protein [Leptospira levettii]|uniref:ABC transporter ATP-binding protein n=1 Tax=Leptospira levettii TaxID=2023178 RepID=UPI003C6D3974